MSKMTAARNLLIGMLVALAADATAQEVRGSISGRVTDTSGGLLIGATVIVENIETRVATELVTNGAGLYQALFLNPGLYKVTARLDGFGSVARDRIELRVEDRLQVDVRLHPAGGSETVEVVATQPLLDTDTATSGVVVDSMTIAEMPLGDGTAYFLARLAPGVEFTGDPNFTRPMDNANLAGLTASGVDRGKPAGENFNHSSSEFMVDGAPNMVSDNRLGFSPPSSAVQEFKVSTSIFDASFGRSGGGSVSLALRSGANDVKGELSYFNRDESRTANNFWANRLARPKEKRDYHRANAMLSGPIEKGRTFFMMSVEYLYDDAPEAAFFTVPTEKMRQGDFSETPVQVYDPFTSRREPDGSGGTKVVRDPFPNNQIPADRIHPVAQKIITYYPLPNVPRDQWRSDLTRNFYSDRNRPYDYRGGVAKVDHVLNPRNRLFLNLFRNWRMEDRGNWSGTPITQNRDYRTNTGGQLGWTSTRSSSSVLDVRLSVSAFGEWQIPALDLDLADLGFSARAQELARGYEYIPYFEMSTYSELGAADTKGKFGSNNPHYNYTLTSTFTKSLGRHSFRAGYTTRMIRENRVDEGYKGGHFKFDGTYTNAGTGSSGSNTHRDMGALLLGMPSSGTFDTNTTRASQSLYQGAFIQDDWRIARRLTLNVGLRWEMEFGTTERYNRNVRGFDLASSNPLEADARKRFAADFGANPAAYQVAPGKYLVTPEAFQVKGGFTFADAQHRDFWRTPRFNLLPRLGFAYQIKRKMVVRGGWGLFRTPYGLSGIAQRGFSRSTPVLVADTNSLPRPGVFDDPAPGGLQEPVGSSLGLLTDVGKGIGTVVPYERKNPQYSRFQLGFQYQLPGAVVFELNYVGSRGFHLITSRPMNYLPAEYLIDSVVQDKAKEDYLTGDVPNPFRGLEPLRGTGLFNNTIDREKLLRGFPQFEGFEIQDYNGVNRYDSAQLRIEKRFSKGFMLSANYTFSRLRDKVARWHASDPEPSWRISTSERPHSYKVATVIELPYGKGRRWGSHSPRVLQALFGGWRLSANYLWQIGAPVSFPNAYYDPTRDPRELKTHYGKTGGKRLGVDVPALDLSGFYFWDDAVKKVDPVTGTRVIDPAKQRADPRIRIDNSRYKRSFPQTIRGVRNPPYHNLDVGLGKTFQLRKGMKLQIRVEALNAENYAQLSGLEEEPEKGGFGFFTSQRTPPRDIQIGARLTF